MADFVLHSNERLNEYTTPGTFRATNVFTALSSLCDRRDDEVSFSEIERVGI
jgi:hypothetical protein